MLETNATSGDAIFDQPTSEYDESWFVYLLPSMDCTAFKVGFSCNPLQRIYSFNHRYFERFDLHQSILLQLDACSHAREIEGTLKQALGEFRTVAPPWILGAAGGHTEWFSAVNFSQAEELLRSSLGTYDPACLTNACEYIRNKLIKSGPSFELWAIHQAQQLHDDFISVNLGHEPTITVAALRDWLDAYRFFDIKLFEDDPAILLRMTASARLRAT